MHSIDVDFDVFKQLTLRRATEDVSYNDVIRELLGLPSSEPKSTSLPLAATDQDWIAKGVHFPAGTKFRANYKGIEHTAFVENGGLTLNGKQHSSPSSAAVAITGSPVNGWRFWECRLPGKTTWQPIESLRR